MRACLVLLATLPTLSSEARLRGAEVGTGHPTGLPREVAANFVRQDAG